MNSLVGLSPLRRTMLGLLVCVLAAFAGAKRAEARCLFFPGVGTLQDCFILGSCSLFEDCVGYDCGGQGGCGPNSGETCSFFGGCDSGSCSGGC